MDSGLYYIEIINKNLITGGNRLRLAHFNLLVLTSHNQVIPTAVAGLTFGKYIVQGVFNCVIQLLKTVKKDIFH